MELVILMGLPASGKSTFRRARFAAHTVISKDLLGRSGNRERRQQRLLEAALEAGADVVVDNTNPRRADRATLIALATSHGARVRGFYFSSRVPECLARNARREGKARVPDVAVLAAAKALEKPSLREGFDQLSYVTLGPNEHEFVVEAWLADEEEP